MPMLSATRALALLSSLRLLLLFALVTPVTPLQADTPPLLPVPREASFGPGFLSIHNGFRIHHRGANDQLVTEVLRSFSQRLSEKSGIRFLHPLGAPPETALLHTYVEQEPTRYPTLGVEESYELTVLPERAELRARSVFGLRHGLETLLQLLAPREHALGFPETRIADAPRFPWRGLMLDPVRHFLPLDTLKRQIDGMAALKLNVLHLRLSDDQGFRMESKRFPKLHELGSDGLYYTQEQLRELVEYARLRGIRVVPEFAVPSHTGSWLVGYPEFGARPGPYTLVRSFGIFQPVMDPTNEALYPFLEEFFREVVSIFPDPYLHIGGDEVTGKHWAANPSIRGFMESRGFRTPEELHLYFNKRLVPMLEAMGKRVIGWDEVLHPELPKTITVQSWRGQKALADSVRQGYSGILSNGYYLDLMLPAESHHRMDPLGGDASGLTSEEARRVLGGEACGWSEFITAENLELKLWPRLAAIAERFWSPADRTSADEYYDRVPWLLTELEWLGVSPQQVQRRMLSRAVEPGTETGDLLALLRFLEPVKRYLRADSGDYTVFRPLNRLVDALWPESLQARRFRELAVRAALDRRPDQLRSLRADLHLWRLQYTRVLPLLHRSTLLRDGIEVAAETDATAAIGLEAIAWLEAGQTPPDSWRQRATGQLATFGEQKREILNLLLDPVKTLVDAASQPPSR